MLLGRYFARQHSHKPVFVVVGMAITKVVVVSVELLLEMSTMSFCVVVSLGCGLYNAEFAGCCVVFGGFCVFPLRYVHRDF